MNTAQIVGASLGGGVGLLALIGGAVAVYMKFLSPKKLSLLQKQFAEQERLFSTFKVPSYNIRDRIQYPVYYINLDRDVKRNDALVSQFARYGVKYTRVPAVYGKTLPSLVKGTYKGIDFQNPGLSPGRVFKGALSPGEVGCTLSHFMSIYEGYKAGHEYIVVMEDDIKLDLMPFWKADLPRILSEVKEDWNIIQLTTSNYPNTYFQTGYRSLPWNSNFWGAQAYVINRAGMENVLAKAFKGERYKLKVADELIYELAGKTRTLSIPLFYAADVASTIGNPDIISLAQGIKTLSYYNTILDATGRQYSRRRNTFWTTTIGEK